MRTRELLICAACAVTLTIAAAGCGSDDDAAAADAASTDPAGTEPVSTSIEPTTPAATDAPPTTALPPALPNGQPLTAGTTYRVGRSVLGRSMTFTPAIDGTLAMAFDGFFGSSTDALGTEVLVGITDLSGARTFPDPSIDVSVDPGSDALDAATVPAPDDFLAYFAALPYVTVGAVETTVFGGFPARSMTYVVDTVETGSPCFGSDRGACLLSLYLPPRVLANYWAGDSGTFYEVTIDGGTFLVEVTDREGAAETAAGIAIGD
jgi:hypothetical protein